MFSNENANGRQRVKTWTSWIWVLAFLGGISTARADALFEYWTELQAVNLTSNDIKITKVDWHGHLDDDTDHVEAGDVIPMADPNDPEQEPTMIGKVKRYSGGVDLEIWFKLIGNEGSEDCHLKIHNPYTGDNTITPSETFPTSQCPSMTPPGIEDSQPAPLYHNIDLPSSGHKLELVALFAFQSLVPDDAGMSEADQKEAADENEEQIDQSQSDKLKFQQETGIVLP